MRSTVIIAAALAVGCGSANYTGSLHHSPLLRGDWEPLEVRPPAASGVAFAEEEEEPRRPGASVDIRTAMVESARELLADGRESGDYGPGDLAPILARLVPSLGWTADNGLASLVKKGMENGAYRTEGLPSPGDIVLFHNLRDANGNGKADDWLTGCGIAIGRDRRVVESVVRTGHAPRVALAWPDGPSTAAVNGRKVNSFLRIPHRSDPVGIEYLAGQLFAGYLDIEKLASASSRK